MPKTYSMSVAIFHTLRILPPSSSSGPVYRYHHYPYLNYNFHPPLTTSTVNMKIIKVADKIDGINSIIPLGSQVFDMCNINLD